MTPKDIKKYQKIHKYATVVFNSEASWETKYDIIFSEEVSLTIPLEYCDPDTSCEEDVCAFMVAFDEFMVDLNKIKC